MFDKLETDLETEYLETENNSVAKKHLVHV